MNACPNGDPKGFIHARMAALHLDLRPYIGRYVGDAWSSIPFGFKFVPRLNEQKSLETALRNSLFFGRDTIAQKVPSYREINPKESIHIKIDSVVVVHLDSFSPVKGRTLNGNVIYDPFRVPAHVAVDLLHFDACQNWGLYPF